MNNRSSILTSLALLTLPLGVLGAEPVAPPTADASSATKPATAAKGPAPCPANSGSHIRRKAGDCGAFAPMRSYDQSQLQGTGETNLAEALRKLDPLFR
jgi:hypothetical protein